eukprot:COSAG02_NODE_1491_length_12358_cov_52.348014_10_plen_144_part_00
MCCVAQMGARAPSDEVTPCLDLADLIEEFGTGFCASHKYLCKDNQNFRKDSCPKTCGACSVQHLPSKGKLIKVPPPPPPPTTPSVSTPPPTEAVQTSLQSDSKKSSQCVDEFDSQYGHGYCAKRVDYCSQHDDFRSQVSISRR